MPTSGGTTKDENDSPPPEGCRGGLWRTGGPTPKADAFSPPRRGFSEGSSDKMSAGDCSPVPLVDSYLSDFGLQHIYYLEPLGRAISYSSV